MSLGSGLKIRGAEKGLRCRCLLAIGFPCKMREYPYFQNLSIKANTVNHINVLEPYTGSLTKSFGG